MKDMGKIIIKNIETAQWWAIGGLKDQNRKDIKNIIKAIIKNHKNIKKIGLTKKKNKKTLIIERNIKKKKKIMRNKRKR